MKISFRVLKKLDVIVIIAALAFSALGLGILWATGQRTRGKVVEIYVGNELRNMLELPEREELFYISTEYGYNIILLDWEGVKMTDADCPSLDCVRCAKITRPGQVIACLPHKVSVSLAGTGGGGGNGVDAIAG